MNVLIISSSARAESLTLRFSKYLQEIFLRVRPVSQADLVDFKGFDFPSLASSELNPAALTPFQQTLISLWEKADLVVFCCPEYNWSTNAEVYSMLEHLGSEQFAYLFENKVFASVGVSSGRGGRITGLEISKMVNKLISFLGKISIVSPKILEAHEVGHNLAENGDLIGHHRFALETKKFVDYTISLTLRWLNQK